MLTFKEVAPDIVPISLLLEADPSEKDIKKYLDNAWCFIATKEEKIVGACIVGKISLDNAEIYNIAVSPENQQKSIGTKLLKFVLSSLKNKQLRSVELGTGTFGHQLAFYQRQGFRVNAIIKNFFIDHYDNSIFENGIQHKDMLRLVCEL